MKLHLSVILILCLLLGCSTTIDLQWYTENDEVVIQLPEINPEAEVYYAEITNKDGRRFAVNLGLPDNDGTFRIQNIFGDINQIEVTTNLDFD